MFFFLVFVKKKSVRVSMALHSASSGINYVVCKMMGIKLGRKRSGWDYSYQRKMMLMVLVGLLLNIIDKNHWTQTDKVSICVFISSLMI